MNHSSQFEFRVPSHVVDAFSELVREIWGETPRREPGPDPVLVAERGDTTLTLVALSLAVPGSLVAGLDLNERFQVTGKLRALIQRVREKPPEDPMRDIVIRLPEGRTIHLTNVDPAEVIRILPRSDA